MLNWSNVFWLVKKSHVSWNIQPECFFSVFYLIRTLFNCLIIILPQICPVYSCHRRNVAHLAGRAQGHPRDSSRGRRAIRDAVPLQSGEWSSTTEGSLRGLDRHRVDRLRHLVVLGEDHGLETSISGTNERKANLLQRISLLQRLTCSALLVVVTLLGK